MRWHSVKQKPAATVYHTIVTLCSSLTSSAHCAAAVPLPCAVPLSMLSQPEQWWGKGRLCSAATCGEGCSSWSNLALGLVGKEVRQAFVLKYLPRREGFCGCAPPAILACARGIGLELMHRCHFCTSVYFTSLLQEPSC